MITTERPAVTLAPLAVVPMRFDGERRCCGLRAIVGQDDPLQVSCEGCGRHDPAHLQYLGHYVPRRNTAGRWELACVERRPADVVVEVHAADGAEVELPGLSLTSNVGVSA